jgi:hypothetical protein
MSDTQEKLPVDLSVDEVAARSLEQANTMIEYARIEEEKKAATSVFSKQLKDKRRRLDELAEAVTTGTELRIVGIREVHDMRRFVVETLRCDTMQIIRSRAMTPDELTKAQNPTLFDDAVVRPSSRADVDEAASDAASATTSDKADAEDDDADADIPEGANIVDPAAVLGPEAEEAPKRARRGLRAIDGSKH